MIDEQFYIYKKDVDWSVLREGFSIPVSTQVVFKERMNNYLKRGEKTVLNVIMDEQTYQVKLTNQAFDERKYPNHVDILQIRYSPQSPFAKNFGKYLNQVLIIYSVKELILIELYEFLKKKENI